MMTLSLDFLLKERFLQAEVVLLAEKASHATIIVFKAANWGAFCMHPSNVEPALLQYMLEAFCLTSLCRHFLWFSTQSSTRVIHWYHGIFLLSLFPPIGFVHVKCAKCIRPERGMCRGLVKEEECLTLRVCLLKNSDRLINLSKQLGVLSPRIPACPRIYDLSCVLDDVLLPITDDEMPVLFLNKIGDVDDAATPLLLENLLIWLMPFQTCQNSVPECNHLHAHHISCLYSFA